MSINTHKLTEERHRAIRERLAADGRVLANELAADFGTSEDTVRRDLRELAKAGACRRVYGGAVALSPYPGPLSVRVHHAPDAKLRLAATAAGLVRPDQTLFLDASTTNIAIAGALPPDIRLTVATNAISVATALVAHPLVSLVVLGGRFDREGGACVGSNTIEAINQMSADLFFIGTCGVDAERGVTAFDAAEAEIKRAMVRNSRSLVIAATTEKLATAAPFRVAAAEAIDHLIVEQDAPADILAAFAGLGATIHHA